jgi:TatD DNase family protein
VIVDSHCHLDYPGLAEREAEVVGNARAAGVGLMVHIAAKRDGWPVGIALAERRPEVLCAVGVHPHEAGREGLDDPAPLLALASHPRVVAIGESGLDYFYDFSPRDQQAASFRAHIRAAQIAGLPLVVHTRDADEDTMALLEEGMAEAQVQPGGILTFKRSDELRATVRDMPLDRLLLETDAPYLAPVPVRGRTNEPAHTAHVARVLAEVRGVSLAEVERATTDNFFRLFAKAAPLRAAAIAA